MKYTFPNTRVSLTKVYLGKRKFTSTKESCCSLRLLPLGDKSCIKLELFEGDSVAAAVRGSGKNFTPLGHTSESILFSDIDEVA